MPTPLDGYTLQLFGAGVGATLSVLMMLFARFFIEYKGFKQVGLSFLLLSASLFAQAMTRYQPLPVPVITALIGLGIALMYWGIFRFRRLEIRHFRIMAAIVALLVVLPLTVPAGGGRNPVTASLAGLLMMVGFGMCGWAVLHAPSKIPSKAKIPAIAGFWILEAAFAARLVGIFLAPGISLLHYKNTLQMAPIICFPISMILFAAAFMWRCIELDNLENRKQTKQLEENESFLRVLLHTIPLPVFHKDKEGRYIEVNEAFRNVTGLDETDIIGKSPEEVFQPENKGGSKETDARVAQTMEPLTYETRLKFGDGLYHEVMVHKDLYIAPAGDVKGIVGTLTDITEHKIHEAKISYMALYDQLTSVPNRNFFFELTEKSLAASRRSGDTTALFYFDLDGFKKINDMHGHDAGDHVLKTVGGRLLEFIRQTDSVGRLGGDEFAVAAAGMNVRTDVDTFTRKIIDAVAAPIRYNSLELSVGVSVGIAFYPEDAATLKDLVKCADTAMYHAKRAGTNQYNFYSDVNAARALQSEG